MVGAWKGKINTLPVMGEAEISVKPGETETTQRYVGKNGTASTIPVVLPSTINGTVSTALNTNITAAYRKKQTSQRAAGASDVATPFCFPLVLP